MPAYPKERGQIISLYRQEEKQNARGLNKVSIHKASSWIAAVAELLSVAPGFLATLLKSFLPSYCVKPDSYFKTQSGQDSAIAGILTHTMNTMRLPFSIIPAQEVFSCLTPFSIDHRKEGSVHPACSNWWTAFINHPWLIQRIFIPITSLLYLAEHPLYPSQRCIPSPRN